eukprot:1133716-Pelagomonas_calceolata.AAC.3
MAIRAMLGTMRRLEPVRLRLAKGASLGCARLTSKVAAADGRQMCVCVLQKLTNRVYSSV